MQGKICCEHISNADMIACQMKHEHLSCSLVIEDESPYQKW